MKYQIIERHYSTLICRLKEGESMQSREESMAWMDPYFEKNIHHLKPICKVYECLASFTSVFTARKAGEIAFASTRGGNIYQNRIKSGNEVIVHKSMLLAIEASVKIDVFYDGISFDKRKLSGTGLVFLDINGMVREYCLSRKERLLVDIDRVAVMDASCSMTLHQGDDMGKAMINGPGKVMVVLV